MHVVGKIKGKQGKKAVCKKGRCVYVCVCVEGGGVCVQVKACAEGKRWAKGMCTHCVWGKVGKGEGR